MNLHALILMKGLLFIMGKLNSRGFYVVNDVLTEQEVETYRQLSDDYMRSTYFPCDGGRVVPGWAGITPKLGILNNLHKDIRMKDIVSTALGESWVFAEHSDLHQNKLTGWHRDTLPSRLSHFQILNVWDYGYNIIKVCFLLQDHRDNDHGLWFKPGTHKQHVEHQAASCDEVCIHSKATDAIVFDQRILHRGQLDQYSEKYGQHRYLITLGYGLNNEYTKQHAAGTVFRQNQQRDQMVRA